jgi:DNA adenine methylase
MPVPSSRQQPPAPAADADLERRRAEARAVAEKAQRRYEASREPKRTRSVQDLATPTNGQAATGNAAPVPFKSLPLKRYGAKVKLAAKIVAMFPPRVKNPNKPDPDDRGYVHFVDVCGGSAAVLFAHNPDCISEVYNDLDGELTNFFDVLTSPRLFGELARLAGLTPVSEVEFARAKHSSKDRTSVERALAMLVLSRQSRLAKGDAFLTPIRNRTRRGMQDHVSAWLRAIEGLPQAFARLHRVLILNRDGLDVIRSQDHVRTLFYVDPPYYPDARVTKDAYGTLEMSAAQHEALLVALAGIKGRFVLSGYRCPLYDRFAEREGWRRVDWQVKKDSAGGRVKPDAVESVWLNYEPPQPGSDGLLFVEDDSDA